MKETRVASRYAKSLISLAQDKGQLDVVHEDMILIRKTVEENRELELLLESPIIKPDTKGKILHALFTGKVCDISEKFMAILVAKHREYLIDDVAEEVESQYLVLKRVVKAEVTSAVPLTDEQREEVLRIVRQLDGRENVQLKENIDTEIIGGLIIQVGDQRLDSSVAGRLEDYRQKFSKNHYIAEF